MGSFSSKTPSSLEALGVAHRHSDVNEDHNMNIDNDLHHQIQPIDTHINESTTTITTTTTTITTTIPIPNGVPEQHLKEDHEVFDEMSEGEASEEATEEDEEEQSPKPITNSEEEDEKEKHPNKKQKSLSTLIPQTPNAVPPEEEESIGVLEALEALGTLETTTPTTPATATLKKPKKKSNMNNVWTKSTSRKGKKKNRVSGNNVAAAVDTVAITPVARFPDRSDDSPEMTICLSKVYKAEKVELSDDRLVAGSSKGYRMVRATRGVEEGAWYFEIKVEKLGQTGHTRLGWSTEKGDLQAPVGYDGNSFGYRDVDGSKVHKAMRDKYGDSGYAEGDVIGFYISLPDGARYAPKQPHFVLYKGQKFVYATDGKEELPQVIPGSEISFFKNGVCQGVAFKDLHGGRYYPAASMYTLPNEPNCVVKFNFGPDFEYFPQDFDCRPFPRPMIEVPYLPFDGRIENGVSDEKKS